MGQGLIQGEFLFNYDKVRICNHVIKEKTPIFTETSKNMVENHGADFYSLVYVLKGKGSIFINGERYRVEENMLVIADRFSVVIPSCHITCEELVTITLDFKPELFGKIRSKKPDFCEMLKSVIGTFDDYVLELPKKYIYKDENKKLQYLFLDSVQEYKARKLKHTDYLRNNINNILIEIARDLNCFTDKDVSSDLVRRIVDYVEKHYAERIIIDDIAKRFNYSRSYVTRMVRRELNMSFAEYVREKRIYVAVGLLSSTEKLVKEIAKEVGYTDVKSFTKCFEEYVGCSPNTYRKRVRETKSWFVGLSDIKSQKKFYE